MKPRHLTTRDLKIIELYSHCQLAMTPQEFYAKWSVTQDMMAEICRRSKSTVQHWFVEGSSRSSPKPMDLYHLALMDFLLENFDKLSEELRIALCLHKH